MKLRKHHILNIILLFSFLLLPVITVDAASLRVKYNGKTIRYNGQQVTAYLDGKVMKDGNMPGILIDDTSMVSYDHFFKRALKATCSYSSSTGEIVVNKNGKTVKMTLGSTEAYVNGEKQIAPVAPVKVKYYNTQKTKVLLPFQFVTQALGYTYDYTNVSDISLVVKLTSSFDIRYNRKWTTYTGTQGNVTVDGKTINVSKMPSIIRNNTALVQAKRVFHLSDINAGYHYDSKAKTCTLQKGDNTIVFTIGSKVALVNGVKKSLTTEPLVVYRGSTNKSYVMVPGEFTTTNLGYDYFWDKVNMTSVITTKKTDKLYFQWDQITPPVAQITSEENTVKSNVINITSGWKNGGDYLTVTGSMELSPDITSDDENIYVYIPDAINCVGEQQATITESDFLASAWVNYDEQDSFVLITIEKTERTDFDLVKSKNQFTLNFKKVEKETPVKNKIKIAIDAGHGANTNGKRTPPMPVDIDFEGDGIIDIKAGQSIREHVANVGVSKYLSAELKRCGFDVYESAFGSTDVGLTTRQANIQNAKCDYSVSIHFNAYGDGKNFNDAQGVSVHYNSNASAVGDSKAFASSVLKELVKGTVQKNRGIVAQQLALCNTSKMGTKASILVEAAFMTNKNEAINMMGNADFWKETAQDIARGICEYTGVPYIAE